MSKWDVYRDANGNPVTVTPEQCAAIRHALTVWADVCETEGNHVESARELAQSAWHADIMKSCLLGRMLYDGQPPLDEKPPTVNAAPAYWLTDPLLCPNCGSPRTGPAKELGRSIRRDSSFVELYKLGSAGAEPGKMLTIYLCDEPWHSRRAGE